jgi:hypothetical protein
MVRKRNHWRSGCLYRVGLVGHRVRLVIPAPADIPLEFELNIPDKGAVAMVRLVWTTGSHYGARFTG